MSAPLHHISTLPADHTVTITDPHGATVATFTLTQPAKLTIAQQNTEPNKALCMQHVGTYVIDLDNVDDTVPEVAQLHNALNAFLAATGATDNNDDGNNDDDNENDIIAQRDSEYSDAAFHDLETLRNRTAPNNTAPKSTDEQIALGNVTTVITVRDDIGHSITESAFADIIRFAQRYGLTIRVTLDSDEYGYTAITGVPQRRIDAVIDITDQLTGTIIELVDTTAPAYASGALPDMDTITELAIWSNPTFGETDHREVPAVVPFDTFVEVVEAHRSNQHSDEQSSSVNDAAAHDPDADFGRITITTDTSDEEVRFIDRHTQQVVNDTDLINAIMLAYEHRLHVHATFRVPSFRLTAYQGTIASGAQYGKNPNALFAIDPRVGGAEVIAPDGTLAPDMHHLAQLTIYSDARAQECVDTTPPLDIATFINIVRDNARDDNAHATHNTDDTASNTPGTLTAADLDTVDTVFNELIGSGIAFSAIAHMDKYHMCALRTTHGDFVDVSHVNDRYDAAQMLDILADAADKTLSVIAVFASPYAEENYIGKLKWDNDENELFISDNSRGDVVIAYLDENDEFCAEDVFAELSYIRVFSDAKMRRNGFAGTNDTQYNLVPVAAFRDKL